MWLLHPPTHDALERFLSGQRGQPFSYREVGASAGPLPPGYHHDHNRVRLGEGAAVFSAGCAALRSWLMFPQPWTRLAPENAPLEVGTIVAMQARAFGFWWLNACRIVYVCDEAAPVRRFGFAYGTLGAHVEQGEERFSIEWLADDSVWCDLRAFSRPRYWPVRLAKPLARRLQRRFVLESLAAMRQAVGRACT